MTERRKHKRYQISYPVECKNGAGYHTLTLMDVSNGGIALTGPGKMRENQRVNLRIFLKNRMYSVRAVVVHVRHMGENLYNIGAKFFKVPEGFHKTFEKEIEEITQFHRECNLYRHKDLTFKSASKEYLKGTPPSEAAKEQ